MPSLDYLDFSLEIERESATMYRAQVLDSPAGQATHSFAWPFSATELTSILLQLTPEIQSTSGTLSEQARRFGQRLFATIFQEEVLSCLRSSRLAAEQQNAGLRLRLSLYNTPELALWPWELLYDSTRNQFLLLSRETPLVRQLPVPYPPQPLMVHPPLRVLLMTAAPTDLPSLDVEREWQILHNAVAPLEKHKLITLERTEKATLPSLQRMLRSSEFHIFHFVGHGVFDIATQAGAVVFEDEQGQSRLVAGSDLGIVLHDHRSLRLAVLNSCEGAQGAVQNPFAGVAQALLQQRVPSVVAMQWPITEQAAQIFAGEFYTVLAQGAPVDTAVAQARRAIFAAGHSVAWAAPVLFMRAPDGVLFDMQLADRQPGAATHDHETSLLEPPSSQTTEPKKSKRRYAGLGVAFLVSLLVLTALWLLWGWAGPTPTSPADVESTNGAVVILQPQIEITTTTATSLLPTPAPLRVGVAEFIACPPEVGSERVREQLHQENPQILFTPLPRLNSVSEAFAHPDVDLALWGDCTTPGQAIYLSAAVLLGRNQGAEREIADPEVLSVTWPVTDTTLPLAILTGVINYHDRRYDTTAAKLSSVEPRWATVADMRQRINLSWLLGNAWLRHSEGRQGSREPFLRARDSYSRAVDMLSVSTQADPSVHSWLLNNLGWAHSYLGEIEAAELDFAQAAANEGYVWPQIGLCNARLRILQYNKARTACDEAILQAGDFAAGYYWRARLNLDYCTGQRVREGVTASYVCWEAVIQDTQKARQLIEQQSPNNPQLVRRYLYYMYYVEGLAYCYREEPEKALSVLEQGLALGPDLENAQRILEMIAGVQETQCK